MVSDLETRIFMLEQQIDRLANENKAISSILLNKVKPMVDSWEKMQELKDKETLEVLYG